MKILLMRHGIAAHGSDDFHRPLTEEGVAGVKSNAVLLASRGALPSKIIASPLIRAQQTAFVMAEVLGVSYTPESLDLLRPESDVEDFIEYLAQLSFGQSSDKQKDDQLILFVSHQPFVGLFVHHLTKLEEFMDTADIDCLSIKSFSIDGGELEWKIGKK
ncbi:MAG: phosphohistidine phosphatase [Candidatus Azotimanducaceae bacterium]|jgi:phosphohistidine phosphatase